MDMEFGPDGALYILEYGDGYFSENPDAKLTKVNFVRGNNSPEVRVQAEGQPDPNVPLEGLPPLTVNFTSDGTVDRDGDRLTTRGTSTATVRSTRASRRTRSRTRRTASSTPR